MFYSKFRKLILLLLQFLFSFIAVSSYATGENKKQIDSIFFHIYNQDFARAETELYQWKNSLKPLSYNLLQTDLLWWKTLSKNSQNDFDLLENDLSVKLRIIGNSSNQMVLEELIYLNYLLRLMAIKNQPLKLLNCFFKINRFLETYKSSNLTIDEQQIFNIYKAIFNISKNKYLLPNSKLRNDNIIFLKQFQNSPNLVQKTTVNYFLAKIYSEIEKSPELTREYYSKLCQLYPNNMIFKNELLSAQIKIKSGD